MAEKIVLELSDKEIVKNFIIEKTISKDKNTISYKIENSLKQEILSTLTMMGYNSKRVEEILSELPENLKTVQEIIPYVIKII
jgi:Holliday junction resolvasome RuvABC DNA-binding subunit